jgi:hypothetical protein|tara:strand:- start:385 stop:1314 length:930 start_codon:yes stop_codon:yes gene_type:complete
MNKKEYIIIRMMGGIGNQLWQYSFGRSLSLKYKKTLVLDISFYNNEFSPDFPKAYKFNFELDKFNLHKDVIIEKNLYNRSYRLFKYFLRFLPNKFIRFFFDNKKKYIIDNFIFEEITLKKKKFDKLLIKNSKSSYFLGYWQNKEYFKDCSNVIKNELRPKIIKKNTINFIKKLKKNHAAIHIRGGDMALETHYSFLSNEYYFKIIKFLKKNNNSLKYHIFTDDVKYSEIFLEKIKLKNYEIISKTYNLSAIEEFFIMQHYKYLIINRSTFSWWSSYLSNKNKTTIFAPKIWRTNFYLPKSLKTKNMKLF